MDDDELEGLIRESLEEIGTASNQYAELRGQLGRLEEALASGEADEALVKATIRMILNVRRGAERAAGATDDGLDATERLYVELKNRMPELRGQRGTA